MNGSRKLAIYELYNGSMTVQPCHVGKKGRFAQLLDGKAFSGNVLNEELGRIVRETMQNQNGV